MASSAPSRPAFAPLSDKVLLDSYQKAGLDGALLAIPDLSRDEILKQLDAWAPLAKPTHERRHRPRPDGVPIRRAADYWRWVDLCEQGGVDSIWQTDRLVSRTPIWSAWRPWPLLPAAPAACASV